MYVHPHAYILELCLGKIVTLIRHDSAWAKPRHIHVHLYFRLHVHVRHKHNVNDESRGQAGQAPAHTSIRIIPGVRDEE